MSRSDDQRIADILEYAEILGLRTRLAHFYHRIDNENIWGAASFDVPNLAKVLRKI